MRFTSMAIMICAGLAATTAPAHAAWEYYISHPLGFSFVMPGDITATRGSYEAIVAGRHDTIIYSSSENGIDYRITVVDMRSVQNKAASVLGEAAYNFQDGKNVLMDISARADRHFGRKLTVDLAETGGRATAQYYFLNGQLIEFQASVAPGGDYTSPNIARFIDSIAFYADMANQTSIEIALPE